MGQLERRVPGPRGLAYLGCGGTVSAIQWVFADPDSREASSVVFAAFYGLWPFMFLYVHDLLRRTAIRAFDDFCPVLRVDSETAAGWRRAYAVLPRGTTWLVTVVAATVGFFSTRELARFFPPLVGVLPTLYPVGICTAVLFCTLIQRVVNQLRMTVWLYRRSGAIDLGRLGPLSALSRLTFTTAFATIAVTYLAMVVSPGILASSVYWGMAGVVTLLAAAIVVWPMAEIQSRLAAARRVRLAEIDGLLEATWTSARAAIVGRRLDEVEPHARTAELLRAERSRVQDIGTWMWSPGSLAGVLVFTIVPPIAKFVWALFTA